MKIIRVEHIRCDDIDGRSFFIVPEGKNDDEISDDVNSSMDEHIQAIKDFKKSDAEIEWLQDRVDSFPNDITIGQAKQLIEKSRKDYDERKTREQLATNDFTFFMEKRGYEHILYSEKIETFMAYWGHYHGVSLQYSDDEKFMSFKPYVIKKKVQ